MQQSQQQQQQQQGAKNTPGGGRRRHPRGSGNTPHKSYVSENDVGAYKQKQMQSASPCTPQKSAPRAASAASTNSKQRPRNNQNQNQGRNRNKGPQGSSPATNHYSPPLAATDAPPIFAGSTFHASPAASALPVPSFFKRSTDSPLSKSTPASGPELSPPSTDTESATPPTPHAVPGSGLSRDSPLEFFFQADRAEKEKTRRASSANATQTPGPFQFSPPRNSPLAHNTVPRTAPNHPSPHFSIPPAELDGDPGQPFGPAFSTPYHERIRAARSSQTPNKPPVPEPQVRGSDVDASEALKRFLFQGKFDSAQHPSGPMPHHGQQSWERPVGAGYQQPLYAGPQQPRPPHPDAFQQNGSRGFTQAAAHNGAPLTNSPPRRRRRHSPLQTMAASFTWKTVSGGYSN